MKIEKHKQREQVWARFFGFGPTGAGKSRGTLELAFALSRIWGGLPVSLINTETGRGTLYLDRFPVENYIELADEDNFHPNRMVDAIDLVERETPGGIIVLDSSSHEWIGTNAVLALADRFGAWKDVRPLHNGWVRRMEVAQSHLLLTCRAKMDYAVTEVTEDGRTKQRVEMLGVGPTQDKDLQYQFTLIGQFEQKTKTVEFTGHVDALQGTVADLVEDADKVAETYADWLSRGTPIEPVPEASREEVDALRTALTEAGFSEDRIEQGFAVARRENRGRLHPDYVAETYAKALQAIAAKGKKKTAKKPPTEPAPDADAEPVAAEEAAPVEADLAASAEESGDPEADAAAAGTELPDRVG